MTKKNLFSLTEKIREKKENYEKKISILKLCFIEKYLKN